ncbi:MAG: hypothetical protein M3254_08090 [Actinomycetota bacterium]|nr:hypothetical protein [Actinomycetota bacterium]
MIGRFVGTVRRVMIRPTAFFAQTPRRGGFLEPLLFALVCLEVSVVLGWLLRLVLLGLGVGIDQWPIRLIFFGTTVERSQDLAQALGLLLGGSELSRFVVDLVISPILGGIGLFVGAGILHLVVRLVVGAENLGFEAGFRVLSYSNAVALAHWIPIVALWFSLYGIYLQVVGIRRCTRRRRVEP